jgi:DNA-binding NarL/FixJ family response regulator
MTNKAIAARLHITELTVKSHVTAVLQALGVSNRTEAVFAVRHLQWRDID